MSDISRDQLLDNLVESIRAANIMKLEELAYALSVAVAEERLRLENDGTFAPRFPSVEEGGKIVRFPQRRHEKKTPTTRGGSIRV